MRKFSEQQRQDVDVGDPLGRWIQMPLNWNKTTLWELAKYVNGRAFKPTDFSETGLQVIKITELKHGISKDTALYDGKYEEKHLLQRDDLLFAWSGNPETSLDVFWWRDGRALLNQHIFRVIPQGGVDKKYLFYLFKFLRPTFIRTARDKATSMGHVKVSDLKRLVAFIPPIGKQQGIADILSGLDDKIELNRRMNETLEAMARVIFKSWFVDFDPVRAIAEGLNPGLDAETTALFPNYFGESRLGKIPDGWRWATVKECCKRIENGGTPSRSKAEYWSPPRIPWLTSAEVRKGMVLTTENQISEEGFRHSSAKTWPPGTTVVALYGATAGQVCMIASELCSNQACCGLVPLEYMDFYVYFWVTSSIEDLQRQARGSAQQNLSQQIVSELPVLIATPNVC